MHANMNHYCFCHYLSGALQQDSLQQLQTDKALEAAVSFSQSLSQWAYIVLGGSVALLFKDLKSRPSQKVRHSFWTFVPGWALLGFSIYQGMKVQSAHIAYLMNPNPQRDITIFSFNRHASKQLWCMRWGLAVFAVWLVFFLICWITHPDKSPVAEGCDAR
jgi:hypothetical protein